MAGESIPTMWIHGGAVAVAAAAALLEPLLGGILLVIWIACTVRFQEAHDRRLLVRCWGTNEVSITSGSSLIVFPKYLVQSGLEFGPWRQKGYLPLIGQVVEIDVPEVRVMVEAGLYCLRVNTKVMAKVEEYSAADLLQNPIPVEQRVHDVIATKLRAAVYEMSLEEALLEIQHIFSRGADAIADLLAVPSVKVTQLMLDPNSSITAADQITKQALELAAQKQQEFTKRKIIESSMATEQEKVKLRSIELQSERERQMLQQEIFGKEGAAMVEASKHAKVLYLCVGGGSAPTPGWTHIQD